MPAPDRRAFLSTATSASMLGLGALAGWWPGAARAQAMVVSGVKFDPQATVGGTRLLLNGAGVRYKLIFPLYAAALYLPRKTRSAQEALEMPGPKRVTLTLLRDLSIAEFGRMISRGVQEHATKEDFIKIVPDVARVGQIASRYDKAVAGDVLQLDWTPAGGLIASFRGAIQGEPFPQPEFFRTLLKIWLGEPPVDAKLKLAMLGQADAANKPAGAGAKPGPGDGVLD
ncbi:MAG: chalcone isomerase family protein [Aquabacterium sp.]|nr:chalcone isomerase family protein [Aquabacterium sp.]